jgi:phosphoglycerol transferase MdoB-like AlkP superfamily enzyme
MIRSIAIRMLLFAAPFAIYALYYFLMRRSKTQNTPETPWSLLFIAGLSLVVVSFIYVGLTEGEPTSGVYVPPHEVNGHIVPGHMEKAKTP